MKMRILNLFIALLLLSGCNSSDGNVEFRHDRANNRVEVFINGNIFTSYFYPPDSEKPVLTPIFTSSGKEITRGYPHEPRPFERVDHPHHVGLWLNFGDVNGLDFWNNSFRVSAENKHRYGSIKFREIVSEDPGKGELIVASEWVDNDNNVLLDEETTFIFSEENGVRSIKRTSRLTAVRDVRFKGNKEGLLGLRMDRAFEEPTDRPQRLLDANGNLPDESFVHNEGVNGVYRNADGYHGGEVWSKRSPWVALRGEKEGEIITVAIFDNKSNPYYPAWSHARGYGLFAVNNLGGKGMHPGEEDVEINLKPGENISFTHLIVIGGDMSDDDLKKIGNDFN
jgi:hypothetical protein